MKIPSLLVLGPEAFLFSLRKVTEVVQYSCTMERVQPYAIVKVLKLMSIDKVLYVRADRQTYLPTPE